MRIVTFSPRGGVPTLGVLVGLIVFDLPAIYAASGANSELPSFPKTALEFFWAGKPALEAAQAALVYGLAHSPEFARSVAEVTFHPPIPRPGKIICVGRNYREHAAEMGHEVPTYPVIFAKFANVLTGHLQPIVLPTVSQRVDYEAELSFVVGRVAKNIRAENAYEYIAGYAPFNDVSVRDYQQRTPQWLQGKTFDTSGPMGPAIVTADEVSDPMTLDISLTLNGEIMQNSNTSNMIFSIPTLVEFLTSIMTLEPGDIVATGTPPGVGDARKPPVYLKAGDVVKVQIGGAAMGLGTLENPVIAAG